MTEHGDHRVDVGGICPKGHEHVHVCRAVLESPPGPGVKAAAYPELDRGCQTELEDLAKPETQQRGL